MKCTMLVRTFLCIWAVSQVTLPTSADAGTWKNGIHYPGGSWYLDRSNPKATGDSNPGRGNSVKERNAPDIATCRGGYRMVRDNPYDTYRKIPC